jgi:hypothetical protein
MLRNLSLAALCMVFSAGAAADGVRAPVLVELFTSEGCSSCPPADLHLARLDSQVVVLGEHVDYWDHQGWKDKFSSPALTERQDVYAKAFGLDSPYTPQMVVDGVAQFTGGDTRRAAMEIDKAADRAKANIFLQRYGGGVRVDIEEAPREADIWMALADDNDSSTVTGGENKGRKLKHVAVVRSLRKIGWIKRGGTFSKQVDLPGGSASQRVVVFLQEAGQGHVLGAALLPAPEI